jgi:hypothetical protein
MSEQYAGAFAAHFEAAAVRSPRASRRLAVAKDQPRIWWEFGCYLLNFSDAQPASLVKLTLWVEPRSTGVADCSYAPKDV